MDHWSGFHGPTLADSLIKRKRRKAERRVAADPFWNAPDPDGEPVTDADIEKGFITKDGRTVPGKRG